MVAARKKLLRIMDANFNRAKEGLRVCEDIGRFILNQKRTAQQFKIIRHRLTHIVQRLNFSEILEARNIHGDVGKSSLEVEFKREKVADIFYANVQRVKESLRVLEEFAKLFDKKLAQELKQLRYRIYDLEQRTIKDL